MRRQHARVRLLILADITISAASSLLQFDDVIPQPIVYIQRLSATSSVPPTIIVSTLCEATVISRLRAHIFFGHPLTREPPLCSASPTPFAPYAFPYFLDFFCYTPFLPASGTVYIAHAHCTNCGYGEREARKHWPMGLPKYAVTVTRATFRTTGPVPVTLGG